MDNLDQTTGKIKQSVGDLTGNKDLEREGKADERAGDVKEIVGSAVDRSKGLAEDVRDKVEHAVDRAKDEPTSD